MCYVRISTCNKLPSNRCRTRPLRETRMNLGKWEMRFKFHYLTVLFLVAFVVVTLYLKGDSGRILEDQKVLEQHSECKKDQNAQIEERIAQNGCDLFSGKWVFDNVSYPLYKERQCSFMLGDYACEEYGRKDFKYQNWRWKPHECNLPRFNGTVLMEKIRGKKLLFVGDSLIKNQWRSMLCMIESSIAPSTPKSVIRNGNLFTFQASEYNATIGFYWSPLLVESNCDDPDNHVVRDRVVRIESIEKHARHWTDADILIFDSFMWWLEPTMRIMWGTFGSPDAIYKRVEMKLRLFEMALRSWSGWLEININRTKTKLFYMSISTFHFYGGSWDGKRNCYNETEPIYNEEHWGIGTDREILHAAESTIQKLEKRGIKIDCLNITHLSDYRKDAHPSIYRKFKEPPTEEQLKNPASYSDCLHWCLPGVPDVWNEILYAYII